MQKYYQDARPRSSNLLASAWRAFFASLASLRDTLFFTQRRRYRKGRRGMNWKGTTVFLTGASSGIGEGIALALAKKGAVLGLVARREDMLTDLAARCD